MRVYNFIFWLFNSETYELSKINFSENQIFMYNLLFIFVKAAIPAKLALFICPMVPLSHDEDGKINTFYILYLEDLYILVLIQTDKMRNEMSVNMQRLQLLPEYFPQ